VSPERRLAWRAFFAELRGIVLEAKEPTGAYPGFDDEDDPVIESYARTLMRWVASKDFQYREAVRDFEAMLVLAEERLDDLQRRAG
jgi:hypothetical protein